MNRQNWTFIAIVLAALSVAVGLVEHRAIAAQSALAQTSTAASTAFPGHVPIDLARSEAPLFDDPVYHGASDPFVIWNPVKKAWFMYYTQRRATLPNPNGVDWVHGSAIALATSEDGFTWKYLGTCQGDHDLSEPLKAAGKGPEPGLTWWAPCLLYENKMFHMWVVLVDGVYRNWMGDRNIVHFTSEDGIAWKYADTCKLSSDRVIDPTVYKVKDLWYMVYKDEADGSHTHVATSKEMVDWTNNPGRADPDGSQEAPFVFHWKGSWWLIVDGRGLRVYKSETGTENFVYNNTVLGAADGTRPWDNAVGHHPGIVMQGGADGEDQCVIFYFTQRGRESMMQVTELELGADGKVVCNRNKHANEESFQQESMARMTQAKQWALAFIMFADAHGNQLPKNFEQAKSYVPGLSESNWEIVSGGDFSRFAKPGQTILLREKESNQSPDGPFFKAYAFMDGHAELISSPDDDFAALEKQRGFLVQSPKN